MTINKSESVPTSDFFFSLSLSFRKESSPARKDSLLFLSSLHAMTPKCTHLERNLGKCCFGGRFCNSPLGLRLRRLFRVQFVLPLADRMDKYSYAQRTCLKVLFLSKPSKTDHQGKLHLAGETGTIRTLKNIRREKLKKKCIRGNPLWKYLFHG